jgi:predicted ribosome-associated RNA-binding protein Tma20
MKHIKKRLRKKLHRKIIHELCHYASLSSTWRKKLFQTREYEIFDFSQSDLITLLKNEPILRKYRFQFSVMVIPKHTAPLWLQEDIYVVFKFFAKEFPEVYQLSGNNPAA